MEVCRRINFPVAIDKTFWGTTTLVFLGILIDTLNQFVSIPMDKIHKARNQIRAALEKKKITVHDLQKICGFLNFLGRCVVPGHAFTRRLYAQLSGNNLKPHYHLKINAEMRRDLHMWLLFLQHPTVFSRPFMDFEKFLMAQEINMYTDASGVIGFGGICGTSWMHQTWTPDFLSKCNPSIEYQELFAVVAGVIQWIDRFRNQRIILFCDNKSVVGMINNTTSSCKNCMVLIRMLVLKSLIENVRVFCRHVKSKDNTYADVLSRNRIHYFKTHLDKNLFERTATPVPEAMWPEMKLWLP